MYVWFLRGCIFENVCFCFVCVIKIGVFVILLYFYLYVILIVSSVSYSFLIVGITGTARISFYIFALFSLKILIKEWNRYHNVYSVFLNIFFFG